MISLKELQDEFQRAVLQGETEVLDEINSSDKEQREVLLGVYQNAYGLRLIEFIENDYEKLGLLLGDDQFEIMVRAYIANTVSHSPNARHYGDRLPEFLKTHEPFSNAPVLGDMASFEWALNKAFDAADAEFMTLEDLASVEPENWPDLNFAPHPSTTRLDLATNVQDIWQALDDETTPPAIEVLDEPDRVIVFRRDLSSMYRSMDYEEAMLWDEMSRGVNFAGLNELSATYADEDEASMRVAGYLKGWIEGQMLAA